MYKPPIGRFCLASLALQVPWDDLRYLFGEILYGGHIVEDWDRRLANAYLAKLFNESLLEGIQLFPSFYLPPPTMPHPQVRRRAPALHYRACSKPSCPAGRLYIVRSLQEQDVSN